MFNPKRPPLLVLPVNEKHTDSFPQEDGYLRHPFLEGKELVCFGSGWVFPVSVEQKGMISEPPLLLVRNKGSITSEGTSFVKGYAHQFVGDTGKEPDFVYRHPVFPDQPDRDWFLVPYTVNAVWLQYGCKDQRLGDSGDAMKQYYGKLLILKLTIEEETAPRLDRYADIPEMRNKQFRVRDQQLLNESWSIVDQSARQYLFELLRTRGMSHYQEAVGIALSRAGEGGEAAPQG